MIGTVALLILRYVYDKSVNSVNGNEPVIIYYITGKVAEIEEDGFYISAEKVSNLIIGDVEISHDFWCIDNNKRIIREGETIEIATFDNPLESDGIIVKSIKHIER